AGEPLSQRNIMEFGKRLETVGDIEMAVRYRVLARRSANLDWAGGKRNNHFRDLAKGSGTSGRYVENPLAAMVQHRADQRGHVVDMHMVALLLALPEQRDRFALGGKPP